MRLVLSVKKRSGSKPRKDILDALEDTRFNISVKSIKVESSSDDTDIVAVEWKKQLGSMNANHAKIIKDAFAVSKYILIEEMEAVPRAMDLPGLVHVKKGSEGNIYRARPEFSKILSKYDDIRFSCAKNKIIEYLISYEETSPNHFEYTGSTRVSSTPSTKGLPNAYSIYALILQKNPELRQAILAGELEDIKFAVKDSGEVSLIVTNKPIQNVSSTAKSEQDSRSMDPFDLVLAFSQVKKGWTKKSDNKFLFRTTSEATVDKMYIYLDEMGIIEVKKVFDSNTGEDVLIAENLNMHKLGNSLYVTFDKYWSEKESDLNHFISNLTI